MSKYDKLIEKVLNPKTGITYKEMSLLLKKMGYTEKKTGKTSGSRVAFLNLETKDIIRLHKPHPGNELKDYVKKEILAELKDKKLL